MKTINNKEPILQFIELLPLVQTRITTITQEIKEYLQYLYQNDFEITENDNEDIQLEKTKNVLNSLEEVIAKRKKVCDNGKEILSIITQISTKITEILENCNGDGETIDILSSRLIDEIVQLENRKYQREMERLQQQMKEMENQQREKMKELTQKKNDIHSELFPQSEMIIQSQPQSQSLQSNNFTTFNTFDPFNFNTFNTFTTFNTFDMKRNYSPISSNNNNQIHTQENITNYLTEPEIKQLEEWSESKMSEIIFNSERDNWITNDVLVERIFNHEKIGILIEDTKGNVFGGFVNEKITKKGSLIMKHGIIDSKAFLFSLRSNGRLPHPIKFPIKEKEYAFTLNDMDNSWLFLFGFGNDIILYDQSNKTSSQCLQSATYDYQNIECALTGNYSTFTPSRFIIIQFI